MKKAGNNVVDIKGWQYYNHAAIPTCAPHEIPDLKPIQDGSIWKIWGWKCLLARWTTDWDCGYETEWWYVIKDTPFQFENVKSKIRTKIRKGLKNFDCKEIKSSKYASAICNVLIIAQHSYTKFHNNDYNDYDVETIICDIERWPDKVRVWGAFCKDNGDSKLCGYTTAEDNITYYKMIGHKAIPEHEKNQINAALVFTMLNDLNQDILSGKYVCNGERTVNHDTKFNDYLEE